MNRPRWLTLLAVLAVLTIASAGSPVRLSQYPREETLYYSGWESDDPREYDPATTRGSGDKMLFSGLFSFNPQLDLTPDLVASWQVQDGTVFTFTLRENAQFHDGRTVTAEDVVYSWERAVAPETQSDTALTYLGDIVGVREMHAGSADHISGLRVVDEHTLEVTIDSPKPYFLFKLTYPTAFVVDRADVESGSDWYRHPNGTGPYKLTAWDSRQQMVYERNENFYLGAPAIRYVVILLNQGYSVRLYESDAVDVAGVYASDVPRATDPSGVLYDQVVPGVDLCTSYAVFDVTRPPFDDPKVRQAFSLAVDRRQLVDVVYEGSAIPAAGLYPPGLPGRREGLTGQVFDPDSAKSLLAESRYAGTNFPEIVLTEMGYGSYVDPDANALAAMWKKYLGITIRVENLQPEKYWDEIEAGHRGQVWTTGWCADYPDPENFADVLFHTGTDFNEGGYSNPGLDSLLEEARTEADVAKRMEMYQQAEDIIIADVPVVFTAHSLSYLLVKPYIRGYVNTPIAVPIERYLSLDASLLP